MSFPNEIELTIANIADWPAYKQHFDDGKIVADSKGKLRYPHGAPVGMLLLVRRNKDGSPVYKESATDWFDPESEAAHKFVWP